MTGEPRAERDPDPPAVYEIRLKGHLAPQWADWFEGLTITLEEDGNTLLAGTLIDQSALHGILKRVRDLAMPLLSVTCVEAGSPDPSEVRQAPDSNRPQTGDTV